MSKSNNNNQQVMSPSGQLDYSNFVNVPFLKDGNWTEFSAAIKIHFQVSDIWKTIQFGSLQEYFSTKFSGSFAAPKPASTESVTTTKTTDVTTKSGSTQQQPEPLIRPAPLKSKDATEHSGFVPKMSDLSEWDTANNKAYGKLMSRLPNRLQEECASKSSSAYDLWRYLEKNYKLNSEIYKSTLLLDYHAAKMLDGESLITYFDRVTELARKLELNGEPQQEKSICLKIVANLSKNYEPIRQVYLTLPNERKDLSTLRSQFLQQDSTNSNNDPIDLNALQTGTHPRNKPGATNKRKCTTNGCRNFTPSADKEWCKDCFLKRKNKQSASNSKCKGNNCPNTPNAGYKWCQSCYEKIAKAKAATIQYNLCTTSCLSTDSSSEKYYLDSGASRHMSSRKSDLVDIRKNDGVKIRGAVGNEFAKADGLGKLIMMNHDHEIHYQDVLLAEKLNNNLLSVSQIDKKGKFVLFGDGAGLILDARPEFDNDLIIAQAKLGANGLYAMNEEVIPQSQPFNEIVVLNATPSKMSLQQLHEKLGHVCKQKITAMVNKGMIEGVELINDQSERCKTCDLTNIVRKNFKKKNCITTQSVGEVMHRFKPGRIRRRIQL